MDNTDAQNCPIEAHLRLSLADLRHGDKAKLNDYNNLWYGMELEVVKSMIDNTNQGD